MRLPSAPWLPLRLTLSAAHSLPIFSQGAGVPDGMPEGMTVQPIGPVSIVNMATCGASQGGTLCRPKPVKLGPSGEGANVVQQVFTSRGLSPLGQGSPMTMVQLMRPVAGPHIWGSNASAAC